MKKNNILIVLICILWLTPNCFAKTKVVFDNMDNFHITSIILKDNHYYAPASILSFMANANYSLDLEQKIITFFWRTHEIKFNVDTVDALYDGEKVKIKSAPFIEKDQFYIPVSAIQDLFSGKVFYNKETDRLDIYWDLEDTAVNTSNPLETINKIGEIDTIKGYDLSNNEVIELMDNTEIKPILSEYFNNSYTRIDSKYKRTMGYKYYLDLYSKDEKIVRIWVYNNHFISLNKDPGYYKLEIPLIYNF